MIFRCGGMQDSTNDGIGMSLDIFFQGCSRSCPGCHNPDLQDKDGGLDYNISYIVKHLRKFKDFYSSIVFLGGEPLEQKEALKMFVLIGQLFGKEIILYTGWLYNDLPIYIQENCDIIVDGAYIEELKTGGFPASSNQNIYVRGRKIELNNNYSKTLVNIFWENKL